MGDAHPHTSRFAGANLNFAVPDTPLNVCGMNVKIIRTPNPQYVLRAMPAAGANLYISRTFHVLNVCGLNEKIIRTPKTRYVQRAMPAH